MMEIKGKYKILKGNIGFHIVLKNKSKKKHTYLILFENFTTQKLRFQPGYWFLTGWNGTSNLPLYIWLSQLTVQGEDRRFKPRPVDNFLDTKIFFFKYSV